MIELSSDDMPSVPGESVGRTMLITLVDSDYAYAARYLVDNGYLKGSKHHTGPAGHEDDFTLEILESKVVIVDRDKMDEPDDHPLKGVGTTSVCAGVELTFTVTRNG